MSDTRLPFGAFAWVAWPKLSSGGLQLVVNLLLARSLGPAAFAPLAVCITAILIADAVLGAAVDVGVLKLATEKGMAGSPYAAQIQKAALVGKLGAGLLIAVPLVAFAGPLGRAFLGAGASPTLIVMAWGALLGLLLLRSVQTWFQIQGRFALFGAADAMQTALKFGGIGVLLALHQASASAALVFYAAAPLAVAGVLLATVGRPVLTAPFRADALRTLLGAIKWPIGAGTVGTITSRMDLFFVAAVAGQVDAGRFSAAQVLVLGFSLIGGYLGVAFAPRIMPLWEAGRLGRVYVPFQLAALGLCTAVFVLCVVFITPLSSWLLPDSFSGTDRLVVWLLPSALASLLNFPIAVNFLLFTNPRFLFVWDLLAIPVLFLAYREAVTWRGGLGAAAVTSGYALLKTGIFHALVYRSLERGRVHAEAAAPYAVAG